MRVVVNGQPLIEIPPDLFIPPHALEVLLDSFTGPLDILLYLIRQQNLDIMDIPMVTVTRQYLQYIELLEANQMDLAADYLVMAALLLEIKSRMLLPTSTLSDEDVETDPRADLVRRLQTYELFQQAASFLEQLPRMGRDFFQMAVRSDHVLIERARPSVTLLSLTNALLQVMARQQQESHHLVTREALSVREKMAFICERLQQEASLEFTRVLNRTDGRLGLVATLLAVLELAKQSMIVLVQTDAYAPLYLRNRDE